MKKILISLIVLVLLLTFNLIPIKAGEIPEEDLMLWFKADVLELEDGDLVDEWIDSSGNDYHAHVIGDLYPVFKDDILNGLPVLKFDESFLMTEMFGRYTQPNSIFVLVKLDEGYDGDHNIMDGRDDGSTRNRITFSQMDTDPGIIITDNTWPPDIHLDFFIPSDYVIITSIFDEDQSMLMVGEETVEGNAGSNPIDGFTIGGRAGGTGQPINGEIAEIIVYNRRVSRGDVLEIIEYLHKKWLN